MILNSGIILRGGNMKIILTKYPEPNSNPVRYSPHLPSGLANYITIVSACPDAAIRVLNNVIIRAHSFPRPKNKADKKEGKDKKEE
jgi:hypothetical protein